MKSLLHHSMGTVSFIKYRFSLYGLVQEGCGVFLVFLLGYVLDFQELYSHKVQFYPVLEDI